MRVTRRPSSLPIALVGIVLAFAGTLLAFAAGAAPALATTFPLAVTNLAITPVEGQVFSGPLAVVADPNGLHTAGEYTGSIEWGDGSTSTATITVSGSAISIIGTHTYIQTGPTALKVSVANSGEPASGSAESTITVADAPLTPSFTAPTLFSGAGPAGTSASLSAFQAGIGGVDNGAKAGEQSGGVRHVNWDAIKLDGSEAESLLIKPGHTVTAPVGSQQERGIELGAPIAVSGDGFATVNASAAGLFEAFSAGNLAAPFNTNTIVLNVVEPAGTGAAPVPATTRALGIAFLNVRLPNTTSIEYRSGQATLATVFAPSGPAGKPSFVGALFQTPVITSVLVTLGTARIFSFDGSNTLPNFSGEGGEKNMVAADDIVLAEPAREGPTLSATAGTPVSGVLASFQDPDPNTNIRYYSASVAWGDGSRSPGTIAAAAGGGYTVSAGHTYTQAGTMPIAVTVQDLGGAQIVLHATALVSPAPVIVSPPPIPTPPAPPISPPPPRCTLAVAKHPKVAHNHLRATARCDENAAVTLTATATIAGGGKRSHKTKTSLSSLVLGHTSANLVANRPAALSITLSPSTLSKLRAVARRHESISIKLTLAVADFSSPAGN